MQQNASETEITVRYAETDQMGIVHHSVYAVWYEAARTEFVKKIGLTYSKMEQMGILTPLAELTSRYHAPAYYEDLLTVRVTVQKLTPARICFSYTVCKRGEAKLLNSGVTVHAWTGRDLKPMNLKKKFPAVYRQIEAIVQQDGTVSGLDGACR